jgi:hypothetical protein
MTYQGSCHCQAVKFEVTMAPPTQAYACNCSICRRTGWLLAFVPGSSVRLLSGEGELVDYQFGKRHLHHVFCRVCGVRPFSRGRSEEGETVAVNLRCVAGLELASLPVETFDGAAVSI